VSLPAAQRRPARVAEAADPSADRELLPPATFESIGPKRSSRRLQNGSGALHVARPLTASALFTEVRVRAVSCPEQRESRAP
jgi:hypothetical protein